MSRRYCHRRQQQPPPPQQHPCRRRLLQAHIRWFGCLALLLLFSGMDRWGSRMFGTTVVAAATTPAITTITTTHTNVIHQRNLRSSGGGGGKGSSGGGGGGGAKAPSSGGSTGSGSRGGGGMRGGRLFYFGGGNCRDNNNNNSNNTKDDNCSSNGNVLGTVLIMLAAVAMGGGLLWICCCPQAHKSGGLWQWQWRKKIQNAKQRIVDESPLPIIGEAYETAPSTMIPRNGRYKAFCVAGTTNNTATSMGALSSMEAEQSVNRRKKQWFLSFLSTPTPNVWTISGTGEEEEEDNTGNGTGTYRRFTVTEGLVHVTTGESYWVETADDDATTNKTGVQVLSTGRFDFLSDNTTVTTTTTTTTTEVEDEKPCAWQSNSGKSGHYQDFCRT